MYMSGEGMMQRFPGFGSYVVTFAGNHGKGLATYPLKQDLNKFMGHSSIKVHSCCNRGS